MLLREFARLEDPLTPGADGLPVGPTDNEELLNWKGGEEV